MERCRAIIDLLVVRPDGFWFKEPVSLEDVPDNRQGGAATQSRLLACFG